jgi:hypothetical protein
MYGRFYSTGSTKLTGVKIHQGVKLAGVFIIESQNFTVYLYHGKLFLVLGSHFLFIYNSYKELVIPAGLWIIYNS